MCLLSHFTFISSNSMHSLCSYLKAHFFSIYYMPGTVLGPGDRAENWNPCPFGAQAKEITYLMVSSAIEKRLSVARERGYRTELAVMCKIMRSEKTSLWKPHVCSVWQQILGEALPTQREEQGSGPPWRGGRLLRTAGWLVWPEQKREKGEDEEARRDHLR